MRPGHRVPLALCFLAGLAMFLLVQTAFAHAILLESSPSIKASISGPDVPIKLRFNVRIDATRSRLTLVRPDASTQPLSISNEISPDTLTSRADALQPGDYRLRWQVLASDGHITRGEIPFQVARH